MGVSAEDIQREKGRLPLGWGRFGKAIEQIATICEPDESLLSSCVALNPQFRHTSVTLAGGLLEMTEAPTSSSYADIYEIQAQADQPTASACTRFVKSARHQALLADAHFAVLAGLTTDRGGSAAQIFACWKATSKLVAGYWMNTTAAMVRVATNALTRIRQAGG